MAQERRSTLRTGLQPPVSCGLNDRELTPKQIASMCSNEFGGGTHSTMRLATKASEMRLTETYGDISAVAAHGYPTCVPVRN
jgi:hypothetical protein